jgi:hypothetical protein
MFRISLITALTLILASTVDVTLAGTLQAISPAPSTEGMDMDGMLAPQVPPVVPPTAATGADLQQQADSRLAESLGGSGVLANGAAITQSQAQAAGLGFIAQHFGQIDVAHTGKVTLQQVEQFIQQQNQSTPR